jgi:opacity protein-like surface antigen
MRRRVSPSTPCLLPFAFLLLLLTPAPAAADLTAFLGANLTPSSRPVRGVAGGAGLLIVGFELEYADTAEDVEQNAPRLRTFMGNGLVQTLPLGGIQFYGTMGGGVYRESLGAASDTNFGINAGGGAKISLLGPIRLRLDYRVFTLRGTPRHSKPQRFYAGLNLKF